MLKVDIATLNNGQTLEDTPLMVYAATKSMTKSGKPYLSVTLGNNTGTIEARMWTLPVDFTLPEVGGVFSITAIVTEYNKQLQLNLNSMQRIFSYSIEDFAREVDNKPTVTELNAVTNLIYEALDETNAYKLKDVLTCILDAFKDRILKQTAACYFHHSGVGGWLKHTLEVVAYTQSIYWALPVHVKECIRYDILLLGAFLHDIGKLKSYTFENGVPVMSNSGRMLEHIVEGIKIVDAAYTRIIDLEYTSSQPLALNTYDKDLMLLEHIIASHHTELEYGAAVNPITLEAVIVCHADKLSSSMDEIYSALKERPDDDAWTKKVFTQHNRQFTDSYKELDFNE